MQLEKKLFPGSNELKIKNWEAKATVIDEELDALECTFNGDNCIEINTEGLSYIVLSQSQLSLMKKLIREAEKHYENMSEDDWKKAEKAWKKAEGKIKAKP